MPATTPGPVIPSSCWSIDDTDALLVVLAEQVTTTQAAVVRRRLWDRIDEALDWRLDLAAGEVAELGYQWFLSWPGRRAPRWPDPRPEQDGATEP